MNKPVISLNPEHQRIYAEAYRRELKRKRQIQTLAWVLAAMSWLLWVLLK